MSRVQFRGMAGNRAAVWGQIGECRRRSAANLSEIERSFRAITRAASQSGQILLAKRGRRRYNSRSPESLTPQTGRKPSLRFFAT
jgi:hypothetical protein